MRRFVDTPLRGSDILRRAVERQLDKPVQWTGKLFAGTFNGFTLVSE
jgi:hypothetical protein